ncbi:hypothetical protein CONLIGDRAFT_690584 [Coniochaeta ligniaria NRRL 30616]|uniref:Uncharacterized protein n=1 Tax=Coniochaeta ligniaria NRRL 30616 TaxID=1408157 RepID=A0A1J7JBI0_9PEZI|nr:hypothetical protein CONLIGDRAFT_690584 [Coniochaeta ligniaria NRRL 30616]
MSNLELPHDCPNCDSTPRFGLEAQDDFIPCSGNTSDRQRNPIIAPVDLDDHGESSSRADHVHPVPCQGGPQTVNRVATQIGIETDDHVLEYIDRRIMEVREKLRKHESTRKALELHLADTEAELLELFHIVRLGERRAEKHSTWEDSSADRCNQQLFGRQQQLRESMLCLRQ